MSERLPWEALIHAGLGRLRLSSEAFWAMTPREFTAAMGSSNPSNTPMDREALARLMARHPDIGARRKEVQDDRG